MARNNLSQQNTRSAQNPFDIGLFSSLSLRYLTGRLGPKSQVILGGYGNGEYNHWYKVSISRPGWIIVIKGGSKPKNVNVSTYDLNKNPIEGRSIFDADSVAINNAVEKYYPYFGTVMGAQSDLYNTYDRIRLDKGDERYYPLEAGSYLICVSATRNEPIDYGVGVVIEFPITELFIGLEDNDGSLMLTETDINPTTTIDIESPVTTSLLIPSGSNSFNEDFCVISATGSVTIPEGSTWLIGRAVENRNFARIVCEPGNDAYYDTLHDHSLLEWRDAWNLEHKADNNPFPSIFSPYTNR